MKTKKIDIPAQSSSFVMNLPQPPLRNAEEYLKAYVGYIYTAVGSIAQEVASIDLHLFQTKFTKNGPETSEIFEHPALSSLHYVNQISTQYDIIEATQTYLELTGEAFWVVLKDEGDTPREFWLIRPDWVKVVPSATDVIDHYDYFAGGVMTEKVSIPKENVIPFKYFNPLNPYRGKGSTQAAALPFDILNFAQEYNRNFFFNSAIPSMVFSTDQKVSEQAIKRFLEQWQSSFGGRSKSNKVAFVGNGLKLEKASFGAKELDFAEQMKMMRDDVLAVFKVPKTVLGLTEDVNKANAEATTRAFMERVVTPRMRKFVDTLNEFYLPMFTNNDPSIFLDFTDPSPEDVELKLKRYANARQNTWMTPNEIRVEENLEPLEGGDELVSQPSKQLDADGNPMEMGDEDDSKKEDEEKGIKSRFIKALGGKVKTKKYIPIVKKVHFKHMVNIPVKEMRELEKEAMAAKFVTPLKKFIAELVATDGYSPLKKNKDKLTDAEKAIAEVLKESVKEKKPKEVKKEEPKEEVTTEEAKPLSSGWSDKQKEEHWKKFIVKVDSGEVTVEDTAKSIFKKQEKLVLDRLEDQVKSLKSKIGISRATPSSVVPTLAALNLMWGALSDDLKEIYIEQGNDTLDLLDVDGPISVTTPLAEEYLLVYGGELITGINETTRSEIMVALSEGFDKGEGIDKLSKRVRVVFDKADKVRSLMIARTEVLRASNSATVEAYRQSKVVVSKEWLSQQDERTCPFCDALDGEAIELTKFYAKVGDTLFGTDDSGDRVSMEVEYTDIGEPPAHVNCRCTTIPVVKN